MEFLLWMFFFLFFHKALLKTKCSKFSKRQNKIQKPSTLDVLRAYVLHGVLPASLCIELVLKLSKRLVNPPLF